MENKHFDDNFIKIPKAMFSDEFEKEDYLNYTIINLFYNYTLNCSMVNVDLLKSVIGKVNNRTIKTKLAESINRLIKSGMVKAYSDINMKNQLESVSFTSDGETYFIELFLIEGNFVAIEHNVLKEKIMTIETYDEMYKSFMVYCSVVKDIYFSNDNQPKITNKTKSQIAKDVDMSSKTITKYLKILILHRLLYIRSVECAVNYRRLVYSKWSDLGSLKRLSNEFLIEYVTV